MQASNDRILLTGATGYVGGRLLRALQKRPVRLRCMARHPEHLVTRLDENTEVVAGDVLDSSSLEACLEGVHTAYYLIHSMGSASDFESEDRRAALNFAAAARGAGVRKIVYLGGLGDASCPLSAHLRSRQEVGRLLRESGATVIELRASIVIGSGSLSFEMIRALTERLPVMITPRWVEVKAQPIAIGDLVAYLVQSLDLEDGQSQVFEIGGRDVVSYGELIREYAQQRKLRRWMIRVPVLTPRLSSLWLGLVTPIYARVGKKLIESIRHPTVVEDDRAAEYFSVQPEGISQAIASALRQEDEESTLTRWCDALSSAGPSRSWAGVRFGNRLIDMRERPVPASVSQVFEPIQCIGGQRGWYGFDWLWQLRGWLDLLVGGVGMRRGRAHPRQLAVGEPVDFWRVEAFEPGHRLLLRAEMKLPGRAWLELMAEPSKEGSVLRQTAIFDPIGLTGLAYWYALYPLHVIVFRAMLSRMTRLAMRAETPISEADS